MDTPLQTRIKGRQTNAEKLQDLENISGLLQAVTEHEDGVMLVLNVQKLKHSVANKLQK